jgi:hypothetical protein
VSRYAESKSKKPWKISAQTECPMPRFDPSIFRMFASSVRRATFQLRNCQMIMSTYRLEICLTSTIILLFIMMLKRIQSSLFFKHIQFMESNLNRSRGLLGCYVMQCCGRIPMFRECSCLPFLPPFAGLRSTETFVSFRSTS